MSLFYGILDAETKKRETERIGRDFDTSFSASKIYFVFNNERDKVWTVLDEFPLG